MFFGVFSVGRKGFLPAGPEKPRGGLPPERQKDIRLSPGGMRAGESKVQAAGIESVRRRRMPLPAAAGRRCPPPQDTAARGRGTPLPAAVGPLPSPRGSEENIKAGQSPALIPGEKIPRTVLLFYNVAVAHIAGRF